ncbi:TolC family protein [Mucilaginibacter sp. PPCGB 2223]|uniref:TolC family protein n=1 Tax=Mucilaginibacter sp. PPCGB 2223 TaxID=1886027 RepID=UPI0021131AED|nr:TolC family protein [Mucilaginibacter sp. PPCGB 2223]
MRTIVFVIYSFLFLCFIKPARAQQLDLNYFIDHALKNDPGIKQNINQQQFYDLQTRLINAQNKAPQVNFTSDYLFVPYFGGGRPFTISPNPPDGSFGYDPALTNGGLYATQLNVSYNLFNKGIINNLQEQNNNQAAINSNAKAQLEHDLRKAVTDQYILVYQFQQQEEYLTQVVNEVRNRKATVEALVKRGLLQQSDYLLLEIEQNGHENDLAQAHIAEVNAYLTLKNTAVITDTAMTRLAEPNISIAPNPQAYYYKQKFKLDSLALVAQQNVFNNKYKPQLSLAANTGILSSDITNIYHNIGMQAGLHLNIPLYDGKQKEINDAQVKISQQSIIYARDNFTVQQKNYLQSIKRQIDMFNTSIGLIRQLTEKQELLIRLDQEKLQNAQLSILEYVKSIQDYATAKQNLITARIQLYTLTNQYNYYNW